MNSDSDEGRRAGTDSPLGDLVVQFLERRDIRKSPVLDRIDVSVRASSTALVKINDAYGQLSDADFKREPAVGLFLNLLHRAWEHVDAALAAFATGSPASAEVVARTALEFSASIIYMLSGDKHSRLIAFFRDHVRDTDRQIQTWQTEIDKMNAPEREAHRVAIQKRRRANEVMAQRLEQIATELYRQAAPGPEETWPKVALRFAEIGEGATHRTVYARMCSQAHGDAEDTLRYFLGQTSGD
jgi:hypothetical protein